MVGNGTPQLRRIYELLQKHDPYPAEATDAVQEAWMDLAELDSTIAGHVASVLVENGLGLSISATAGLRSKGIAIGRDTGQRATGFSWRRVMRSKPL